MKQQPKPCQFTVDAGGVVCGAAPTWRNEDEVHGNCFFCQDHKDILAADETYGGRWIELPKLDQKNLLPAVPEFPLN